MNMKEGVRFATTAEELKAAYQLRYKVYVESMGRLSEKADHSTKELYDEVDKNSRTLVAVKNGEPTGTLRLIWGADSDFSQSLVAMYGLSPFLKQVNKDKICIIERLMVDEKYRGSMTALRMYREVMQFVLDQQAEVVLLDCEPHKMSGYLKLGFRPFGEAYAKPGIGPVIRMALIAGDFAHLERVSSPFVSLIKEDDLSYCRHVGVLQKILSRESAIVNKAISNTVEFFHFFRAKQYDQSPRLLDTRLKQKLNAYA